MIDIIKGNGWVSVGRNEEKTFFSAVENTFDSKMKLEVVIETDSKVLVNGNLFHRRLIPTIQEAEDFLQSLDI